MPVWSGRGARTSPSGVTPAARGPILVEGVALAMKSPALAMGHGLAFLAEDRKETGGFLILDCLENIQKALTTNQKAKNGFAHQAKVTALAKAMVAKLRIKTPGPGETGENLSGGNQQELPIACWLLTKPRILIPDEPARGIDVDAKAETRRLIAELAGRGVAVLMISSEMPEVLGMSGPIMLKNEAPVSGFLHRDEADQVRIMAPAAK